MGQIQSLQEFVGLLLRRRLLIGAITVFGVVITLLYAISKPDVFESTAVIQVQSPTVSSPEATSTSSRDSSAQRLQAIQQRLTTRENMLAVIARHGLFTDLPLTDDQKVHALRLSLRFETVASAASSGFGQAAEVSALLISAQAASRSQAARVANDFAQGILDAGANGQMERALEALGFFRDEERNLKKQIDALEAESAAYQSENRDALPAQRDLLRTELTSLESELRSLEQSLVAAKNGRAVIEGKNTLRATDRRQLDGLISQIVTLEAQSKALESRRAEILATLTKVQEVDRRIDDYDRSLAQLQSQYEVATRRSADAESTAKLQDRQQGESFTLLERAAEPDYAITGGRRKLVLVGVISSFLLAVIAAFAMDLMYPALRTRRQLERELDLRPIVAIPELKIGRKPFGNWSLRGIAMPHALSGRAQIISNAGTVNAALPSRLSLAQTFVGGLAVIALVAIAAALT
jgi:uncharacterized protein involved in exopolysaccharide biosynthesis